MSRTLKQFRARALAWPGVRREYDRLGGEFEFLDEILRARAAAGLNQADVAARIGTTQSAVARLEQVRLVRDRGVTKRSTGTARRRVASQICR